MKNGVKKALILGITAAIIATGLSAIQLFPYIQFFPFTNRTGLSIQEAGFSSLPIPLLLGILSSQEFYFPEWIIYPGVAALLLASLGWRYHWTQKERFWGIVTFLGLVLSLGDQTPLFGLFYRAIPGFNLLRVPARWSLITLFGIALLAAWGWEKWIETDLNNRKHFFIVLMVFGTIYIPAAILKTVSPNLMPFQVVIPAITLFLVILCMLCLSGWFRYISLLILLISDLWITSAGYIQPVSASELVKVDQLTAYLIRNLKPGERFFSPDTGISASVLVEYSLESVDGYDSVQISRYGEYVNRAIGCNYSGYAVTIPPMQSNPEALRECSSHVFNIGMLKALNTRLIILSEKVQQPGMTFVASMEGKWIYDLGPGPGQVFSVSKVSYAAPEMCFEQFQTIDPTSEAIVEENPIYQDGKAAIQVLSQSVDGGVEIMEIAADRPGLLVRSETWAPGWRAWVDGKEVSVLRTDCALQGIWVGGGEHEIRFEYLPSGYLIGCWLSLLTAGVVLLTLCLQVILKMGKIGQT